MKETSGLLEMFISYLDDNYTSVPICKNSPRCSLNMQGPAEVLPLSVVGRVYECLTQDRQQFEHFT